MGEEPIPDLREDSEGVGVTQTSLPTLYSDDSLVGLDNVQSQSGLETESETSSKKLSATIASETSQETTYRILLSTSICH